MEDKEEIRSAIARRGIAYTYQALQDRYDSSVPLLGSKKRDRRLGEFKERTADLCPDSNTHRSGVEVLRTKLCELALKVYEGQSDAVVFEYLAYVMAALAGQPGKEVLVINSKEAAAHVSYHLMRYLGYRPNAQMSDSPKKRRRTNYYPAWLETVQNCDKLAGINSYFQERLATNWVDTETPSDAGLVYLQKNYGDKKWCIRIAKDLKPV